MSLGGNLVDKKGFSLIEIVLVLALSGMLLAVVFLSIPPLQAGQKDQSRKKDTFNVLNALTVYQGKNSGENPPDNFRYIPYEVKLSTASANNAIRLESYSQDSTIDLTIGQVSVVKGAKCYDNFQATPNNKYHTLGTSRQIAVIVPFENGTDFWCIQS